MTTTSIVQWQSTSPLLSRCSSSKTSKSGQFQFLKKFMLRNRLTINSAKKLMAAVGCLGWLVNTGRPDVAFAHSWIAQHMANPTTSAMEAVKYCFGYLKGAKDFALRSPLYTEKNLALRKDSTPTTWEFFCDSDFGGNHEVQNKRRSQNGYIATQNDAPVD